MFLKHINKLCAVFTSYYLTHMEQEQENTKKPTCINLFAFTGGVFRGALDRFRPVASTSYLECFADQQMHKFAYNIGRQTLAPGLRADVVCAYVKPGLMQSREHKIPNERGLFSVYNESEDQWSVRQALHEGHIVARLVGARKLIFFFAQSPVADLDILRTRGFVINLWQVALKGEVVPLAYVWVMVAYLPAHPPQQHTETKTLPLQLNIDTLPRLPHAVPAQLPRAILWDLSPTVVKGLLDLTVDFFDPSKEVFYYTSEKPSPMIIDHGLVDPARPFALDQQPVTACFPQPEVLAQRLGW